MMFKQPIEALTRWLSRRLFIGGLKERIAALAVLIYCNGRRPLGGVVPTDVTRDSPPKDWFPVSMWVKKTKSPTPDEWSV